MIATFGSQRVCRRPSQRSIYTKCWWSATPARAKRILSSGRHQLCSHAPIEYAPLRNFCAVTCMTHSPRITKRRSASTLPLRLRATLIWGESCISQSEAWDQVLHWDEGRKHIRLQLWDISGQERVGNMTRVRCLAAECFAFRAASLLYEEPDRSITKRPLAPSSSLT